MQHEPAEVPKQPFSLRHLASDIRIAAMLVLGFAAGIPYQLVYITQSAWLYEAKVPIAIIGMMSFLVGIVIAQQGAVQEQQFGAQIYTGRVNIPQIYNHLDEAGRIKTPEQVERLEKQADGFLKFVEQMGKV